MTDAENTIRDLQRKLKTLTESALYNESVLRRFQARELALLMADSLPDLLYRMTFGMRTSFGVKAVRLILADPDKEYRNLLANAVDSTPSLSEVRFEDDLVSVNPLYTRLSQPDLGRWNSRRHKSLLPASAAGLDSIAIIPLVRGDKLLGSLNLGSSDPGRFAHQYSTDFMNRLATIATVCLENMVNREKLILSGLTDSLTGLHNRRYLEGRLKEEVARAARYRQPLSCLFVDADYFKRINDSYGHAAGDAVLQELAVRVRSQLRTSDIATRYGGEEFVILLPQTGRDEAIVLAERIRQMVASKLIDVGGGQKVQASVSIGVGESFPAPHAKHSLPLGEQLLIEADNALYQAKSQGRNRVVLYQKPNASSEIQPDLYQQDGKAAG